MEKHKKEQDGERCPKCKVPLGGFFGNWGYYKGDKYCGSCLKKKKFQGEVTYANIKNKKRMIEEVKCTCKHCGHVWHYLVNEEKTLRMQAFGNSMIACGMCCSPFSAFFSNKAADLNREAGKFKKCSKCGTTNIKKETHYYDKE